MQHSQMDSHLAGMHSAYGSGLGMHPPQHTTPPHVGKHMGAVGQQDSPGFSEDFPHLALINDLLDDSMFG